MKKLLDSKFLFIVALSVAVLIILGIGSFYLFDDADDTFVKSGYVLNPLSAKVEKYFFNENAAYKENLSSMVTFKDVDNKDASVLRDSFLHYNDGSLSFLKNGAILDLNTIDGSEAVNFYNITSKSIIEKDGNGYLIKNSGNDIKLKNFIGRINDNKYIVVGSLEAKIPGNEKNISGDYFEIVYAEEGIVNIENKDVKFQVTAEGTLIYAGNIVIDLGAKKISMNGEDIMSITAITINGDENIEIIPEAPEEEETNEGENGDGTGEGAGGNGGGAEGENNGGTDMENIDIDTTEDIIVSLKNANIGSTSVDVTFDIYNQTEEDSFTLKVTNLDSGRTIDMVSDIEADEEIRINLLSPNTKYLFTVINELDGNKYFQKIFETNDFGIKLEKVYATDSELGFKVTVDKDTDITNAKLTLYKYNEETKQNEVVVTSYTDNTSEELKYSEKVTYLSSIEGNIEGVHEIVYDGLDSDTIYTAVLDEFSLTSTNFKDIYNITVTAMTLKETPEFKDMSVSKDIGAGSFKLSLGNIEDIDNAIESYTYLVYELNDPTKPVIDPITKSNASPIEVKIGDKENQLKNDTNYFYKVVIEYFDNEKYVEYILNDTINFVMGSDPYITVVPDEKKISYDRIGATIYLTDNSCLIAMPSREKCVGSNTTRVIVTTVTSAGTSTVFSKIVDFDVSEDEIKYELELDGLQTGTTYTVEVEAVRTDKVDEGSQPLLHTDESKKNIATKTLSNFMTDWADKGSSANHVVNLQTKFIAEEGTGTLSPEESADSIKKVVVKLYNGSFVENIQSQTPIATKSIINTEEFNIKESFYDNNYAVTTDGTFGLDIEGLKEKNEGKLSEYYTVAIYAYYDENETNAVRLTNNITSYKISPILLMDNIEEPIIVVDPITKRVSGLNSYLINPGTIVGYNVTARFDVAGLVSNGMNPTGVNLFVYNDKNEKVGFYVKDGNDLVRVDEISNDLLEEGSEFYQKEIFIDYGSDYNTVDDVMRRGNNYYIGYTINVDSEGKTLQYPDNKNKNVSVDFGKFVDEVIETEKETPTVTMYIAKSTANSITYRYTVRDPDNAFYKENDADNYGYYYKINDGEEQKLNLKVDESITNYHAFSGDFTINGLSNGDLYSLYYKKNGTKTGKFEDDVKNYFDSSDSGNRVFDGYYNLKEDKYNFKFEVINNPLFDNKVTIKILADEKILDRIVNYRVTFTDSQNHTPLVKDMWKLTECNDVESTGEEEVIPRCFSVDYVELKNAGMKSTKNTENIITVNIDAYYDNGLTGYDYKIGTDNTDDYNYMIFQNNIIPGEGTKYVSFAKGGNVTTWSEANDIGKGFYTYSKGARNISYTSALTKRTNSIGINLTSTGYSSNYGILNPKMITVDTMNSDKKTFSFNSITPKIAVGRVTRLINGAITNLTLSGADLDDFCENEDGKSCVNNANSEFYLYVDTWINTNSVGDRSQLQRPTVKVKINKNNPSENIVATLDGLFTDRTYYYNVYAYLNKNGKSQYTQLFDISFNDHYETKTYAFSTLTVNDLFHSFEASYKPNAEGEYSDKLMTTKINLIAYENNVPFNFDMGYAFCELDDSNCGLKESNTNIFKSMIAKADIKTSTSDTIDISEYINDGKIEFDKLYWNWIFVIFDYYEGTNNLTKYYLKINRRDDGVRLRALEVPDFIVSREASLVDGEYAIDFTVNVKDTDRVLNDGKYFVALKDTNGNIVGDLQVKDEDGTYVTVASDGDYKDYAFDALVANKSIRIKGLDANTKYTIEVYNKAFINNYSETIPKENRVVDVSKSHTVYTVNDSGVAFGKDLLFSATEKSIVVTFLGGSKFDNVREVGYTVGLWDDNQATSSATYGGKYVIGENNKKFEMFKDTGDWKFIIDDPRMNNVLGQTYIVALSFKVVDGENEYYYDSITNPEFAGKAQYVKDNS